MKMKKGLKRFLAFALALAMTLGLVMYGNSTKGPKEVVQKYFDAVKAAGCEFVYIRLGGYDDGELYTDRYYIGNIAGAKAAGLKVGVYWHAEEKNAEEIRNSVDYLVTVLGDDELNVIIIFYNLFLTSSYCIFVKFDFI